MLLRAIISCLVGAWFVHYAHGKHWKLPEGLGAWLPDDGSNEIALQVFFDAVVSRGSDPREPPDLHDVAVEMLHMGRVTLPSDSVVIDFPWADLKLPLAHHLFHRYMRTREPKVRSLLRAVLAAGARTDFETPDMLQHTRTPLIVQCLEDPHCDSVLAKELLAGVTNAQSYRLTHKSGVVSGASLVHVLLTRTAEVELLKIMFTISDVIARLDAHKRVPVAALLDEAVSEIYHRTNNSLFGSAYVGDVQVVKDAFWGSKTIQNLLQDARESRAGLSEISRRASSEMEVSVYKILLDAILDHPNFDWQGLTLASTVLGYNVLHTLTLHNGAAPLMERILDFIGEKSSPKNGVCEICCKMLSHRSNFLSRTPLVLAAILRGTSDPAFQVLKQYDMVHCSGEAYELGDAFGTTPTTISAATRGFRFRSRTLPEGGETILQVAIETENDPVVPISPSAVQLPNSWNNNRDVHGGNSLHEPGVPTTVVAMHDELFSEDAHPCGVLEVDTGHGLPTAEELGAYIAHGKPVIFRNLLDGLWSTLQHRDDANHELRKQALHDAQQADEQGNALYNSGKLQEALEVWTEATDLLAKHGTQAQQHVSSLLRRWRMPSFLDAYGGYTVSVSSIPYASQFNSSHRKVNLREWVQSWNQANSTGADSPGRPRSSLFQLQEAVHEAPEYLFSNDFLRQTQSDPEDSVLFDDMQYITKQILSEVPGITWACGEEVPAKDCDAREPGLQFFLGPTFSGAPHHWHGSALNILVEGRKSWVRICVTPPIQRRFAAMQRTSLQQESQSTSWKCVQNAGDALYVPTEWGHETLNLEPSIGLAFEMSLSGYTPSYHLPISDEVESQRLHHKVFSPQSGTNDGVAILSTQTSPRATWSVSHVGGHVVGGFGTVEERRYEALRSAAGDDIVTKSRTVLGADAVTPYNSAKSSSRRAN